MALEVIRETSASAKGSSALVRWTRARCGSPRSTTPGIEITVRRERAIRDLRSTLDDTAQRVPIWTRCRPTPSPSSRHPVAARDQREHSLLHSMVRNVFRQVQVLRIDADLRAGSRVTYVGWTTSNWMVGAWRGEGLAVKKFFGCRRRQFCRG